jgi:membrane-associated phospholipid phosphatase
MSRAVGLGALLRDALAPLAPGLALLTQLGDTWFLLSLALLAYLLGPTVARLGLDRRDGARLIALALAAIAVTRTLKVLVAAPRPGVGPPPAPGYLPAPLAGVFEWMVHTSSAGFPSGHAVGATAVWGGLAILAAWPDRSRRLTAAAAIVALVSVTRLGLGLHVAVDVVVGVAVGLVVLVAVLRVPTPGAALALAMAATVVTVGAVPDEESTALAGAAVGATVAWLVVGDTLARAAPRPRRLFAAALPLVSLAAGTAVVVKQGSPPILVVGLLTAGLLGLVVAVPALADTDEKSGFAQYFSR